MIRFSKLLTPSPTAAAEFWASNRALTCFQTVNMQVT